jgi:benzoylformate decarboxylase
MGHPGAILHSPTTPPQDCRNWASRFLPGCGSIYGSSAAIPGSLFFPDAGALGWGLPAAIGLQLGNPSRRVLAILGDGALDYTVSALWTAARYRVPVVFVVARNREYAALKKFAQVMHLDGIPGLELPDIDITGIATAYAIPATQVTSLAELTAAVQEALACDGPRLVEVPQQ